MACAASLLNCLICGGELDGRNGRVEDRESVTNFKRAFNCFCRLLNISEETAITDILDGAISGLGGRSQVAFVLPCCEECSVPLNEIGNLQWAIDELRAAQMKHAETLKLYLLQGGEEYQDNPSIQIRNKLIASLHRDQVSVKEEGIFSSDGSPPSDHQQSIIKEEPISSDPDDDCSIPIRSAIKRRRPCSPRQNTVGDGDDVSDGGQDSGDDFVPSPNSSGSEDNDDDNDKTPPRTISPPTKRTKPLTGCPSSSTGVRKVSKQNNVKNPERVNDAKNEYFAQLSDKLLLYKYTLIRIRPGEGLFCEESGCSSNLVASGTDFHDLEKVKIHVKAVHYSKDEDHAYHTTSRKCPLCPEPVTLPGLQLRKHLWKRHNSCSYICPVCWKPFERVTNVVPHMWTHQSREERKKINEANKKFSCDQCGKRFIKLTPLQVHLEIHKPATARKMLNCDQCSRQFMSKTALGRHKEREHPVPDGKQYRYCPVCNKQFYWRDSHKFSVHMSTHGTERPYVCDLCGKSFTASILLKNHQNYVHPGDSRFQCEYCEMNYKTERNLKRHQQTAHKDKVQVPAKQQRLEIIGPKIAFPCQFCDKAFPLKCRLSQHMKKFHGGAEDGV